MYTVFGTMVHVHTVCVCRVYTCLHMYERTWPISMNVHTLCMPLCMYFIVPSLIVGNGIQNHQKVVGGVSGKCGRLGVSPAVLRSCKRLLRCGPCPLLHGKHEEGVYVCEPVTCCHSFTSVLQYLQCQ